MIEGPKRQRRGAVLFIAGTGRSGSTILGEHLARRMEGVHLGESRLWDLATEPATRSCGCGEDTGSCPYWSEVLKAAFREPRSAAEHWRGARRMWTGPVGAVLLAMPFGPRLLRGVARRFRRMLEQLYDAVLTSDGVVIDSSKRASYGAFLSGLPGVDVHIVHVVRDPRGVAFSWLRRKTHPESGDEMKRYGVARSAVMWSVRNGLVGRLRRAGASSYQIVRYEDLVEDPDTTFADVLAAIEAKPGPGTTSISGHPMAGNPSRFERAEAPLRADDEWTRSMRKRDRDTIDVLTRRLRARYGYTSAVHHPLSQGGKRMQDDG